MEKLKEMTKERENHKLYVDTFSDAKTKEEYAIITDVDTDDIITIKDEKVIVNKMSETQKNKVAERVEKEKQVIKESKEKELREKFDAEKAKEEKVKEDQEFEKWLVEQNEG